jgi:SAM-dependent methyltransferase
MFATFAIAALRAKLRDCLPKELLPYVRCIRDMPLRIRARSAVKYALRKGLIGREFAEYGRRLGRRLVEGGNPYGMRLELVPLVSVRYFEFAFAQSCLLERHDRCLDVSSPFLFSLYQAESRPNFHITIINPDRSDLDNTRIIVNQLGLTNIDTRISDMASIAIGKERFDAIWSLSVIEHIDGEYTDTDSVRMMFDLLNPGGRLILTFPVDRQFWVEDRVEDPFGTQRRLASGRFFYQRYYDPQQISERILRSVHGRLIKMEWFGEVTPGWINREYEPRRRKEGLSFLVNDPRVVVDHMRQYSTWEEMPGCGVCGLCIERVG